MKQGGTHFENNGFVWEPIFWAMKRALEEFKPPPIPQKRKNSNKSKSESTLTLPFCSLFEFFEP
jgi:hypothetical protein